MVTPTRPTPGTTRKRLANVLLRTTPLSVQLLVRTDDTTTIIVGYDNQEQFSIGPFDHILTIEQALSTVAADLRMYDSHVIAKNINDSVKVKKVADRLGV